MQEKVSIIVVRYGQKFPSLGSRFGFTRRSLVMPNRDPRDGNFRPYLTPMKDTYNSFSLFYLVCVCFFFFFFIYLFITPFVFLGKPGVNHLVMLLLLQKNKACLGYVGIRDIGPLYLGILGYL